jgi:hypothetical protein
VGGKANAATTPNTKLMPTEGQNLISTRHHQRRAATAFAITQRISNIITTPA